MGGHFFVGSEGPEARSQKEHVLRKDAVAAGFLLPAFHVPPLMDRISTTPFLAGEYGPASRPTELEWSRVL
jgi:hypothetical protein